MMTPPTLPRLATRLTLAVASVFSVATASLFAPALSAAPAAEIVSLSGQGETRPAQTEAWSPASLRQTLEAGADVRTLAYSSAALLLADRTQIRMNANAQVRLRSTSAERTALDLAVGRLWARTRKAPGTLELQTPAALAVVRGTDWDVEVDADGHTLLTVLSGRIEVSNSYGSVDLGPSEQASVVPGSAPVKRLLVSPRERVQWVMANPIDASRYREFDVPAAGDPPSASFPPLAAVREALEAGAYARAHQELLALEGKATLHVPVQLLLADFDLYAGDLVAAEQRLARLWQEHGEPRAAARRAEVLAAQERMAEARALLDEALATHPEEAALLLAEADWYRLEGVAGAALPAYREAQSRAAVQADPALQAATEHGLGRALMERGDLARARAPLARAVELAPSHSSYRGEQALEATLAYRLDEAEAGYRAALELSGDDFVSLAGAGLLALQRGDAALARQELLKALVIEPRFARGQMWLAIAEFQLGNRAAALDSLDRASLADPNDPLPWQIRSIIENDQGEPAAAILSARAALERLPYLKSLDQLSNDSQGSANLGKALGDFGLEHWARAYAHASSHPLWAGNYFFLADRYESDFSRKSALFQGYLADPTVFGASERAPSILARPDTHFTTAATATRDKTHDILAADANLRHYGSAPLPYAWQLRAFHVDIDPRAGTTGGSSYRAVGPDFDIALGLRPREDTGIFALYNRGRTRISYADPTGLIDPGSDAQGPLLDHPGVTRNERTDLGAAHRWSADSQTWVKWHSGRLISETLLSDPSSPFLQFYFNANKEDAFYARHTTLFGEHRLSFGWETVRRDGFGYFGDILFMNLRNNQERYRMPWLATEWREGPWSVYAEAYWPRMQFAQSDLPVEPYSGEILGDPRLMAQEQRSQLMPRVGLSHRFSPGSVLHLGYLESLRAPGTHTLSPVAMGGIPVDNQYMLTGSHARKTALQFDHELSSRTFLGLGLQHQTIRNLLDHDGRPFANNMGALFDNLNSLGPSPVASQTTLATYEASPYFGAGRISSATATVNHVLGPRWSLLGSYTHTHSKNLDADFAGKQVPGFPRHLLLSQTTYYHGERWFSLARLVYRSSRYHDQANLAERPPSWSLSLAHNYESADRNWNLGLALQSLFKRDEDPTLAFWVRRRW